MQKSISAHTAHRTSEQLGCGSRRPHQVSLLIGVNPAEPDSESVSGGGERKRSKMIMYSYFQIILWEHVLSSQVNLFACVMLGICLCCVTASCMDKWGWIEVILGSPLSNICISVFYYCFMNSHFNLLHFKAISKCFLLLLHPSLVLLCWAVRSLWEVTPGVTVCSSAKLLFCDLFFFDLSPLLLLK